MVGWGHGGDTWERQTRSCGIAHLPTAVSRCRRFAPSALAQKTRKRSPPQLSRVHPTGCKTRGVEGTRTHGIAAGGLPGCGGAGRNCFRGENRRFFMRFSVCRWGKMCTSW